MAEHHTIHRGPFHSDNCWVFNNSSSQAVIILVVHRMLFWPSILMALSCLDLMYWKQLVKVYACQKIKDKLQVVQRSTIVVKFLGLSIWDSVTASIICIIYYTRTTAPNIAWSSEMPFRHFRHLLDFKYGSQILLGRKISQSSVPDVGCVYCIVGGWRQLLACFHWEMSEFSFVCLFLYALQVALAFTSVSCN